MQQQQPGMQSHAPATPTAAAAAAPAAVDGAALRVLTFSGSQPFVVRCERETRVKDIVAAIAEIWGFRDAAKLFTLCRLPPGVTDAVDASKLTPGALLAWNDRACQKQQQQMQQQQQQHTAPTSPVHGGGGGDAAADGHGHHHQSGPPSACSTSTSTAPLLPLLLVRCVFGSTERDLEANQAVLSLTAAQIAADVAARRYPVAVDAGLCDSWVKQGQHAMVLHMAASWPSGPCLIVGPAHALSGGAAAGLKDGFNLGLNAQGFHIMTGQQHRARLSIDAIASATTVGDVLDLGFTNGQPHLLLQLPGAEALAEAFKALKEAATRSNNNNGTGAAGLAGGAAAAAAAAVGGAGASSPGQLLERPLAAAIRVLRPWEQSAPVLRASLRVVQEEPRLLAAQLVVVNEHGDDGSEHQRIMLSLTALAEASQGPVARIKLGITPLSNAERQALAPPPGEERLVALDLVLHTAAAAAPGTGGAAPPHQPGAVAVPSGGAHDGVLLRGSPMAMPGSAGGHPAQLLQRLQLDQQAQLQRQGLMAAGVAGFPGGGFAPDGLRPVMYGGVRPGGFAGPGGFRPGGLQQQSGWVGPQQQQFGGVPGMLMRPGMQQMRPMGGGGGPMAHQPYTLVGQPGGHMVGAGLQQQQVFRGPGGAMMQMRPQQQQPMHMQQQPRVQMQMQQPQQQFALQMQQSQMQQQFRGSPMAQQMQMQQQQQPMQTQQLQQQVLMQQVPGGGYVVVQQPQQQAPMQQQTYMQPQQQVAMQQPQQQMVLMQPTPQQATGGNMMVVTMADGRQVLMTEGQLQQLQQQQQAQLQQQQQLQLLQQQQQQQALQQQQLQQQQLQQQQAQQQQLQHLQAQQQAQQLQQQQQAQQQVQAMLQGQQQGQQPPVMPGVFTLGPHGELIPSSQPQAQPDSGQQQLMLQQQQQQLLMQQQQQQLAGMGLSQPQQGMQPQSLGLVDLNAAQQQFVAVSSAMAPGAQLMQQPASGGQQQLFMAAGQQQPQQQPQQVVLQQGAGLMDGHSLLQQQQRRSSGANISAFGAGGGATLLGDSGPASGGGMVAGLGFLQQQQQQQPQQQQQAQQQVVQQQAPIGLQGMGGLGGDGGMGGLQQAVGVGGLQLGGYGPSSQGGLNSSSGGLGAGADPPGLNFGAAPKLQPGFMQQPQQQQQQQQQSQQMLQLGGLSGLSLGGDALQGGSDGLLLANGGMPQGGLGTGFLQQTGNQNSFF